MSARWIDEAVRAFPDHKTEEAYARANSDKEVAAIVDASIARNHAVAAQLEALLREHGADVVLTGLGIALGAPLPGMDGRSDDDDDKEDR